jgi:hypothetical protein
MVQTMIGQNYPFQNLYVLYILYVCYTSLYWIEFDAGFLFLFFFFFFFSLQGSCSHIIFDSSRSNIHSAKATNSMSFLCIYDV